jgi:hypothetical protein
MATMRALCSLAFGLQPGAFGLGAAAGQEHLGLGTLGEGVDEPGENDFDHVDFAFQEQFLGEARDGPAIRVVRGVVVTEFRRQFAPGARQELGGLAAHGDEDRRGGIVLGHFAEQIRVQGAAESLVGADDDERAFFDFAFGHEGMGEILRIGGEPRHEVDGHGGEGPAVQGRLLGTDHLGRSDHLHGLRDLGRVANRLDAPAYFPRARHGISGRSA